MKPDQSESGFTLVEALAALAVFSVAAIGLARATGDTARSASHLEAKLLASIVAENQMVEAFSDPRPLRAGITNGEAVQLGKSFNWVRLVGSTNRDDVISITITVLGQDENTLAELQSLKRRRR